MAEDILHFGSIRFRVTGSGSLKLRLTGLDDNNPTELLPLTMSETSGREPLRLSNYKAQRARLRVYTDEIDEIFRINRIVIFVKALYTDFPH